MKKILKKAGIPLLFASIIGFKLAPEPGEGAVFMISLVLMVLGGLFLIAGPFLGEGKGRVPDLSDADRGELEKIIRETPDPARAAAGERRNNIPAWVPLLGAGLSGGGLLLFLSGPNGVNPYTVGTFSMLPLGVFVVIFGMFYYGSAATRRNMVRGAIAAVSFLMILGGIYIGVFIAAGAFDDANRLPWGVFAVLLLLAGIPGAYYGIRYQQSAEGCAIGRQLGFVDASGGGADGIYDSKGFMNGVEVLFNIEPTGAHRNSPAYFRLDVLCRCGNLAAVELSVKPEGPLGISVGSLPRVPDVPHWDFFDVRCNNPSAALQFLPAVRREKNVFNDGDGFRELALRGGEFKAVFIKTGYADAFFVKRVLSEVSLLSAKFA